jgi:signal transduction histidine kinase
MIFPALGADETSRARLAGYGVAVLATAALLVLRWLLWPVLGDAVPHMTFFPAIVIAALWGGLWPGLLATLLGAAAANYFITGQLRHFQVTNVNDLTALILFLAVGAIISGLSEAVRRALRRIQAEEQQLAEAKLELAHANRVTTMGQLMASIAHELNQPILAAGIQAQTGLRWLERQPPDLGEAREAVEHVIKEVGRAGDVMEGIRALVKKTPAHKDVLDLNRIVLDVVALTRGELLRNGVTLQTQLVDGLPVVEGDRVQLQQVLLNLIMNAVEAMKEVAGKRLLLIGTARDEAGGVRVAVQDSGIGLKPDSAERLFRAFYTTKPDGMGMGLSICSSIIQAHGGRVWASANAGPGASFQFTLPARAKP